MPEARGVYFRREDYASFWVRVFVDAIDLAVFGVLCLAFTVIQVILGVDPGRAGDSPRLIACGAIAFSYFVLLKRSRFRTLGYRAGRARIVGLDGQVPGVWPLIVRLTFGLLGPLNWLIDLLFLAGDRNRQALRDKFANTYVIRNGAQPAGTGRITHAYLDLCFFNCLFREVEVDAR
jgi:RDD family